jgi:hypothetical protein
MNCCICYNNYDDCDDLAFICETCSDGKVCQDCMVEIDPVGIGFLNDDNTKNKIMSCPCCRTKNWKYLLDYILFILIDVDNYTIQFWVIGKNKAFDLFVKNWIKTDNCNITLEDDKLNYLEELNKKFK